MGHMKDALARIEKNLSLVVGKQHIRMLEPTAFIAYCASEIEKASKEPIEKSRVRLSLLYKSVLYTSAAIEDVDSDNINVPVFVVDTTSLDDQKNEIYQPSKLANMGGGGGDGSYFTKALTDVVEKLQKSVGDLLTSPVGQQAAAAAEDAEKAAGGKKPPFPPKDGEEDAEKAGKKPPPFPPKDGEEEGEGDKKAQKQLDGAFWPDDLNDKTFVEKGGRAEPTWGNDR